MPLRKLKLLGYVVLLVAGPLSWAFENNKNLLPPFFSPSSSSLSPLKKYSSSSSSSAPLLGKRGRFNVCVDHPKFCVRGSPEVFGAWYRHALFALRVKPSSGCEPRGLCKDCEGMEPQTVRRHCLKSRRLHLLLTGPIIKYNETTPPWRSRHVASQGKSNQGGTGVQGSSEITVSHGESPHLALRGHKGSPPLLRPPPFAPPLAAAAFGANRAAATEALAPELLDALAPGSSSRPAPLVAASSFFFLSSQHALEQYVSGLFLMLKTPPVIFFAHTGQSGANLAA